MFQAEKLQKFLMQYLLENLKCFVSQTSLKFKQLNFFCDLKRIYFCEITVIFENLCYYFYDLNKSAVESIFLIMAKMLSLKACAKVIQEI